MKLTQLDIEVLACLPPARGTVPRGASVPDIAETVEPQLLGNLSGNRRWGPVRKSLHRLRRWTVTTRRSNAPHGHADEYSIAPGSIHAVRRMLSLWRPD